MPDVIVSDVAMPDQDGYDFMKACGRCSRRCQRCQPRRSPHSHVADRRRALLAGFQTHLTKPVDPTELVATVASLAGRNGKSYSLS